jgi:tRNA dimethylallyltransferase
MPRVVAVVGPTATGKSALALALAERLGGEVVNADSMQLYRGMDIGTAKLSVAEQRGVTHHLLDVWDVTRTASVADYQERARACVDDLLARGVSPVLVGGSGLYVRAVLDEIEFPGTDAALRAELEAQLAELGAPAMHERLSRLDPGAGSSIAPMNGRKIVRALELIELTGQPLAPALPDYAQDRYNALHIGVDLPTADLDVRIAQRVNVMIERGFVDEVRALADAGLREGLTASRALGYAQLLAAMDGRLGFDEAVTRTVQATRRFVRRQRSWFRRDPRIRWYETDLELVEEVLDAVGR